MVIHVVQPGETAYGIAQAYGVPVSLLVRDNGLTQPDRLAVGQALVVRFPQLLHTVQQGETLLSIAEEYGVTAVVYSHCHGESRFGDSIRGEFHGIRYMLVSGDYLDFHPALVLP